MADYSARKKDATDTVLIQDCEIKSTVLRNFSADTVAVPLSSTMRYQIHPLFRYCSFTPGRLTYRLAKEHLIADSLPHSEAL